MNILQQSLLEIAGPTYAHQSLIGCYLLAEALQPCEWFLGWFQSTIMIFNLRTDCTILEVIRYELKLAAQVGCQFVVLWRKGVSDIWRECELRLLLKEAGDIVDDCFEVVHGLVQLPDPLVDACLIMQGHNDERTINSPSTFRSVLQHIFSFVQKDNSLVELLLIYAFSTASVELVDLFE